MAASLAPTIEALASAISPALAEAGLGAEIVAVVERALVQAPAARPRLRCAPEIAGRIGKLLAISATTPTIEEAPELLPREAQIFWDQGYDHIDLDACIAQIRACIASHLATASRARTMTADNPDENGAAEAARRAAPDARRPQARAGAFLGVPIEVTISVGKARPLVSELVELRRDSVLTLDSTIDDPVELYIGDRLIARGELQEIGDDLRPARRPPDGSGRLLA